jgi:hypothetical protein
MPLLFCSRSPAIYTVTLTLVAVIEYPLQRGEPPTVKQLYDFVDQVVRIQMRYIYIYLSLVLRGVY